MPQSYSISINAHLVCQFRRAIYDLKQSPRAWFGNLTHTMKELEYWQSNGDHTLFFNHTERGISILLIYVDDMIIIGDNEDEITSLIQTLATEFEIKILRELHYFLGIEVSYSSKVYVSPNTNIFWFY